MPLYPPGYYSDVRKHRNHHHHQDDARKVQYVYLPPIGLPQCFPMQQHNGQRHWSRPERRRVPRSPPRYATKADGADERVEESYHPAASISIRNQRFQSLAAMSRLQQSAASIIQQEYRFYRRRRMNRKRQMNRRMRSANEFFDAFIRDELQTRLLPECLLEILKETRDKDLVAAKEKEEQFVTVTDFVYTTFMNDALDDCILSVFQSALDSMVKEYMSTRIDLTRASVSPTVAIANDFLDDWQKELLRELLPEVLEELVVEYFERKRSEDRWQEELRKVLQCVAQDALVECVWEAWIEGELEGIAVDGIVEDRLDHVIASIVVADTTR